MTGYDPEQPYPTLKLSLTWKFVLVLSQRCLLSEEMSVIWNFIKVLSCFLSSYVKGLVGWHRNYDLQKNNDWEGKTKSCPLWYLYLGGFFFFSFPHCFSTWTALTHLYCHLLSTQQKIEIKEALINTKRTSQLSKLALHKVREKAFLKPCHYLFLNISK